MEGTSDEPVDLMPSDLYPGRVVEIREAANGRVELRYARVTNPWISRPGPSGVAVIDHCVFTQALKEGVYKLTFPQAPIAMGRQVSNSIFRDLGAQFYAPFRVTDPVRTSLFDGLNMSLTSSDAQNSVFLKNTRVGADNYLHVSQAMAGPSIYWPSFAMSLMPAERDGKTYFMTSSHRLSFDQAEAFAKRLGGHLATVRSADDAAFLGAQATAAATHDYTGTNCGVLFQPACRDLFGNLGAMIGLTDRDLEGTYTWASGEPLSFLNWAAGQPNGGYAGNYVRSDGSGGWDDYEDPMGFGYHPWVLEVPGSLDQDALNTARTEFMASRDFNTFRNNAILNVWWDPDISHWMRFFTIDDTRYFGDERNGRQYVSDNFWGTTSQTIIQAAIHDYDDDVNLPDYIHDPILTTAPETTYPFVVNIVTSPASPVGAEPVTFTVTFNRDMDQTVQPQVSFGPATPLTDYTVHPIGGGWTNARTWVGAFNITSITGDGYQLIRVAGARAVDDPWLATGDDAGRFRFEIITSGTEAMELQATGMEGRVDLAWTQNDFDLLAGYNLYRSTSPDSGFARINTVTIPAQQKTFADTDVQPGQLYYYMFTVVKTDMTESAGSNVASAAPKDTIPPTITHTPITTAQPGLALTISAEVTDNVTVSGVTLFHRAVGGSSFSQRAMVSTTGHRYSATLEGALVTVPGLEY